MRALRPMLAFALALALGRCASVDVEKLRFACTADDQCLAGWTCQAGECARGDGGAAGGQAAGGGAAAGGGTAGGGAATGGGAAPGGGAAGGAAGVAPTVMLGTPTLGAMVALNATANPNGQASDGWFRYDTTAPGTCNDTFGTRAPASGGSALGSGTAFQGFSQLISPSPNQTYFYCALASNAGGTAVSPLGTFVLDTQAPSVPGMLMALPSSASRVDLTWAASTDNIAVTEYRVRRCQGTGCAPSLALGFPLTTSLSDLGLTAATRYGYDVVAADAAGNASAASPVVYVNTPSTPVRMGYSGLTGSYDTNVASTIWAERVVAPISGTVSSMSMYIEADNGMGRIRLGLYTDDGGVPYQRLAETVEAVDPTDSAWLTLSTTSAAAVTAGQLYWLAHASTGPEVTYRYDPAIDAGILGAAFTYGPLPVLFPGVTSGPHPGLWSFYADVTP